MFGKKKFWIQQNKFYHIQSAQISYSTRAEPRAAS